ncbi:unnamed protein product [Musa acuminata var. zebrina]
MHVNLGLNAAHITCLHVTISDRNQIWSILLKCKLLFGISNK